MIARVGVMPHVNRCWFSLREGELLAPVLLPIAIKALFCAQVTIFEGWSSCLINLSCMGVMIYYCFVRRALLFSL